MKKKSIY